MATNAAFRRIAEFSPQPGGLLARYPNEVVSAAAPDLPPHPASFQTFSSHERPVRRPARPARFRRRHARTRAAAASGQAVPAALLIPVLAKRCAGWPFGPPARAPPPTCDCRPPLENGGRFLFPSPARAPAASHMPLSGASAPLRCGCGRLREVTRGDCCPGCPNDRHNTACNMRQVSLAERYALEPPAEFCATRPHDRATRHRALRRWRAVVMLVNAPGVGRRRKSLELPEVLNG